jgi:hypothetical protein
MEAIKRPVGVTVIAIIAWVSGLVMTIGGIVLLFNLVLVGDIWQATLDIFVGVLTILVGIALLQGNKLARVVATVVLLLNIAISLFALVTQPVAGLAWWGGLAGGLLALVGLFLLWTRRASAFFRN